MRTDGHSMLRPITTPPELTPAAVYVWLLHLDEVSDEDLLILLSDDERSRAARFHFDRDRHRFIVGRAGLRQILATYLNDDPTNVKFSYSAYGKPRLQDSKIDLRFNVSHSDSLGVIAVTRGREIGVDIEKIRDDIEVEQLANRFFSSAEIAAFSAAEHPKTGTFFRIWTCKEAFLKGQGMGLALPLDSFDVEADPGKPAKLLATRPDTAEAGRWSFHLLEVASGFAGAVAVKGQIEELAILGPYRSENTLGKG